MQTIRKRVRGFIEILFGILLPIPTTLITSLIPEDNPVIIIIIIVIGLALSLTLVIDGLKKIGVRI